jgi:hypothetical protein
MVKRRGFQSCNQSSILCRSAILEFLFGCWVLSSSHSAIGHNGDMESTTSSPIADAVEFACYSKACAPPPVGSGGSRKGGVRSRSTRVGDLKSRGSALRKYIKAKKDGDEKGMTRYADEYRRARNRVEDNSSRNPNNVAGKSQGKKRNTRTAQAQSAIRKAAAAGQTSVNQRVGAPSSPFGN